MYMTEEIREALRIRDGLIEHLNRLHEDENISMEDALKEMHELMSFIVYEEEVILKAKEANRKWLARLDKKIAQLKAEQRLLA